MYELRTESVNVANDPVDIGRLNPRWFRSPTLATARKSPPGRLRSMRRGSVADCWRSPPSDSEIVVASKLRSLLWRLTPLWKEAYRRSDTDRCDAESALDLRDGRRIGRRLGVRSSSLDGRDSGTKGGIGSFTESFLACSPRR
jgi:hypothetical protein